MRGRKEAVLDTIALGVSEDGPILAVDGLKMSDLHTLIELKRRRVQAREGSKTDKDPNWVLSVHA